MSIIFRIKKTICNIGENRFVPNISEISEVYQIINRQLYLKFYLKFRSYSLFNKSEFLIFRNLLEIFELIFFNESTFKGLRRNYQGGSVALESSERADVSHNEFCVRETF